MSAFARSSADPVLLAYLSLAEPEGDWARRAVAALNAEIAGAETLWATGRWGALADLGWDVEHVASLFGAATADLNAHTDAALLRELQRGRWRGSPDDLRRIGVYFAERGSRQGAALVDAHLGEEQRGNAPRERGAADDALSAHLLNRVYQSEGDLDCLEAARAWFREAVPGDSLGALALLAAATAIAPNWDRRYLPLGRVT